MPEDKDNSFTPSSTPLEASDTSSEPQATFSEQPSDFGTEPATGSTVESVTTPAPDVEPATTVSPMDSETTATEPIMAQPSAQQPPAATESAQPQSNAFAQPPKKSKKKWIIAGIASFIAVLLVGGSVLAYVLYQSPQKLLGDAIAGLYQARAVNGTVSYAQTEDDGTKVVIDFATASKGSEYSLDVTAKITASSVDYVIEGNGVYDKDGNVYFKLGGIKDALAKISSGEIPTESQALLDKYENKWIKVSAKDLNELSPKAEKTQNCYKELNEKLSQASFRKDIEITYRKHQFVVVKDELGVKDGDIGYQVDINDTIADDFEKAFKETASYKELESICDEVLNNDSSSSRSESNDKKSSENTKVNVWISQWEHKLQQIELMTTESTHEVDATVNFDYSKTVDVKVPTDTISFKQLVEDIQTMYVGAANASSAASMDATEPRGVSAERTGSTTLLNRLF